MKIRIAAAALSFALVSGSAIAQPGWVERYDDGISTRQLMSIVRPAGLRPVTQVARRGHNYIVHAVDSYGDTKRVVIDADFGDIVRIVSVSRRARFRDDFGPRRWFDDDVAVLRPPASIRRGRESYDRIPEARLPESGPERAQPSQPSRRTASVDPTQRVQPPIPRSRPSVPSEPAASPSASPSSSEASKPEKTTPTETTASTTPAAPAPAKPATKRTEPPARAASPRVILEGGPTPKTQRDAADRGVDISGANEANKKAPSEAPKLPPMQGLE